MNTLKLIAYPFGLAIAALGIAMFVGMAAFGFEPIMWAEWQNQLVSSIGTMLGFAGIFLGLWLAVREDHRAVQ